MSWAARYTCWVRAARRWGSSAARFCGFTPAALGAVVAGALVTRLPDPAAVEEVIFGQVLQAGSGMNVARQIALASGPAGNGFRLYRQ